MITKKKVKIGMKSKFVPVNEKGEVPMDYLVEVNSRRSPRSRAMDGAYTAKRTFTAPVDPRDAARWINRPNKFDIEGIDSPVNKGKAKVPAKKKAAVQKKALVKKKEPAKPKTKRSITKKLMAPRKKAPVAKTPASKPKVEQPVDEAMIIIAGLFKHLGRNVSTSDELVIVMSLDMKWMKPSDAREYLEFMRAAGYIEGRGGFIRPTFDIYAVDVPEGYRPNINRGSSWSTTLDEYYYKLDTSEPPIPVAPMEIRGWHQMTYPDDRYALINPNATFGGLYDALNKGTTMADYIGTDDLIVTGRTLAALADMTDMPYESIEELWHDAMLDGPIIYDDAEKWYGTDQWDEANFVGSHARRRMKGLRSRPRRAY